MTVTQADIAIAYDQAHRGYPTQYDYEMDLRDTFAKHRERDGTQLGAPSRH